jgi:predicted HicB family RNase H-like nuclease
MSAEHTSPTSFTQFLHGLFETGDAVLNDSLLPVSETDWQTASALLREAYAADVLHFPADAPAFHETAANWAALHFYRAAQLTLLRQVEEAEVLEMLKPFADEQTPEAHYSADLALRHLPQLHKLAAGLAPGDVLVKCIRHTAQHWPLSGTGIVTETAPDPGSITQHTGLLTFYADRIIALHDKQRAAHPALHQHIKAALGDYAQQLWPELDTDLLQPPSPVTNEYTA